MMNGSTSIRHLLRKVGLMAALVGVPLSAFAQLNLGQTPQADHIKPNEVIFWDYAGATRQSDGSVEVGLRLRTDQGFTVYKKRLEIKVPIGTELGTVAYPPSDKINDPISGEQVEVFRGGDFIVTVRGAALAEMQSFSLGMRYTGCTEVICLFPYTETLMIDNIVEADQAVTTDVVEQVGKEASGVRHEEGRRKSHAPERLHRVRNPLQHSEQHLQSQPIAFFHVHVLQDRLHHRSPWHRVGRWSQNASVASLYVLPTMRLKHRHQEVVQPIVQGLNRRRVEMDCRCFYVSTPIDVEEHPKSTNGLIESTA